MKLPDDDTLATATLDTPIGRLRIAAIDDGLAAVLFPNQKDVAFAKREGSAKARAHRDKALKALDLYFEGRKKDFSGLTLAAAAHGFPEECLEGARRHSLRRDALLCRHRTRHRQSERHARRRAGQWAQPDPRHRAVTTA